MEEGAKQQAFWWNNFAGGNLWMYVILNECMPFLPSKVNKLRYFKCISLGLFKIGFDLRNHEKQ